MIRIDKEPVKTDVLVVGGGIAGLMAAIHAADLGVDVLLAEKANTKRSGSGATGNDHFCCYIPEVHGRDLDPIIEEDLNSLHGNFQDLPLVITFLEQSYDRVKNWHQWGISMKPSGKWDFSGHAFPGRPRIFLKYAGHNQKTVLTRQAKKRGVHIENHMPIVDVITRDGRAVGAIGLKIDADKPVVKLIQAKAVVLATGTANRLYPSTGSPGWLFNVAFCPACTGTGRATALRAGARLANMEIPNRHAGPKYFARCGKATWIGVYKDPHGNPIGPFVTRPTRKLGDITADVWNSVFTDMQKSGKGPSYIDCTETAQKDIDYMLWGLKEEGNTAMLDYMQKEGIDVRRHKVEFMQYEPYLIGSRGIDIDIDAQTSVEGLYAAGDEVGNFRADMSGAATFGWIAGKSAAERAKAIRRYPKIGDSPVVENRRALFNRFMKRQDGAGWKEANLALQQVMNDYAGVEVRSETLLTAGLKYLRDLKKKALASLAAENSHELMRCLETLDLMDCGEAIFLSALERKETRGRHVRSDYPFTNPLLENKFMTVRRENGKFRLEWRIRK